MRIIFDSNSLQTKVHLGFKVRPEWEEAKGRRLTTLLETVEEAVPGASVEFYDGKYTRDALADCGALVFLTRKEPFDPEELEAIHAFVTGGGGLLIMSNHGDHAEYDCVLAVRFGFRFEPSFFRIPGPELGRMSGDLLGDHPILKGEAGEPEIQELFTNTTCHITSESGTVLATLDERMKEKFEDLSPRGTIFALALDGKAGDLGDDVKGRIVAIADSGFVGTKGADRPGVGIIDEGDNMAFHKRVLRWLVS